MAQPDATACAALAGGAFAIMGGYWTVASCCPPDIGVQGGVAGQDGLLDNNDFIVFIELFFAADPLADRGMQGGVAGADAQFDNNDFIVFIDLFFTGC